VWYRERGMYMEEWSRSNGKDPSSLIPTPIHHPSLTTSTPSLHERRTIPPISTQRRALEEARRCFHSPSPSVKFEKVLNEAANGGRWEETKLLYCSWTQRLKQHPKRQVFRIVLKGFKRSDPRDMERLNWILNEMGKYGEKIDVTLFNSLLDACIAGSSWRRSIKVFVV